MANETKTSAPRTATVGERLEEQAHQGDTTGVEHAAAAVEDLRAGGYAAERGRDERDRGAHERAGERTAPRAGRGPSVAWGVAAGLGTWVVAGMIGRAFRR